MRAPDAPDAERLAAAERDAARADLCRFIAACYYEPAPEFAEERLFESMHDAASRIDTELAALAGRLREAFSNTDLQDLLVDYTRLFLGPVQALARPYASVWLTGENQVMQEATAVVMAMYGEAGFEIAEDFRELPDHVAAELEFLYLLIHRDNEARWSGRAGEPASLTGLRRRFLEGHLGRWLGPFLLAVHGGSQTPFYATLAELTRRFVELEGARPAVAAT